jgi:hypothetical protein
LKTNLEQGSLYFNSKNWHAPSGAVRPIKSNPSTKRSGATHRGAINQKTKMSERFYSLFGKIFTKETLDSFSINYSPSHLDEFAYAHTENQLRGWLDLFPPPSINEIHSRFMINKMKKNVYGSDIGKTRMY